MKRTIIGLGVLCALSGLAGCASTKNLAAGDIAPTGALEWMGPQKRVVLDEPIFDLREKTTKGWVQWTKPREDWNGIAKAAIAREVNGILAGKGIAVAMTNGTSCTHEPEIFQTGTEAVRTCAPDASAAEDSALYALRLEVHHTYSAPFSTADGVGYAVLAAVSIPLPGIAIGYGLYRLPGDPCDSLCNSIDKDAAARGDSAQPPDSASLSLIDRRTETVVWRHSIEGGDWRDGAATKKALQELFAGSPLAAALGGGNDRSAGA